VVRLKIFTTEGVPQQARRKNGKTLSIVCVNAVSEKLPLKKKAGVGRKGEVMAIRKSPGTTEREKGQQAGTRKGGWAEGREFPGLIGLPPRYISSSRKSKAVETRHETKGEFLLFGRSLR